ncbi:MAG: EthD family reductase [Acidimicrobiales bacterium]
MIRFLVTYDIPHDPTAFDQQYGEVHQPLTARLPGILSYTVHRAPRAVRGSACHQVVEVTWPNWDAVERAFASPEGLAAAGDMANLEAPTRSCLYEVPEVPGR